jgi:iron complex transport system ATP-binding protein
LNNPVSHILSLQNLNVGYDKPLLKNVSVDFQSGNVIGIIGNNGKGKTTLLKNISGLLQPMGGQILFDQKNIFELMATERSRMISLSFASNHVSFPISVFELVSMGRYPYNNHWAGLSNEDKEIISNALDVAGIKYQQNNFVTSLSDGERQKAFIAKTISQQTPVSLFDEPTAFLDYASKKHFFQSMKKIATEQSRIVVISSHDIDFLTAYADELFMIKEDESVLFDKTSEIMNSAYFKNHFTKA